MNRTSQPKLTDKQKFLREEIDRIARNKGIYQEWNYKRVSITKPLKVTMAERIIKLNQRTVNQHNKKEDAFNARRKAKMRKQYQEIREAILFKPVEQAYKMLKAFDENGF